MSNGKTKKKGTSSTRKKTPTKKEAKPVVESKPEEEDPSLVEKLTDMTGSAFRFVTKTTETSLRVGKALLLSPEKQKMMEDAGQSLRDLRLVAGMTLSELSESLDINDKSILEAVENGTATLSFELILRLSALLARHDPVPFIIKYTRTYDPDVWDFLEDWGVGRLPLQYERERKFINIYRRHDEVRKLSDEDYDKLVEFTQAAFDMAVNFMKMQEPDAVEEEDDEESEPEE